MTEKCEQCHIPPCQPLQDCQHDINDRLDLILARVDEMALRQANMAEIVVTWNNAKGFVATVQSVSRIIRWVTLTSITVGALWYFIQHGSWPK